MARELVEKYIDGRLYEFEQLGATASLQILSKITKLVGEPIAIAMSSIQKKDKDKNTSILDETVNSEMLGKAVRALVDRIDETDVVGLVKKLASDKMLCDHKPVIFDDHYIGDFGHLGKVLMANLEVQYGNFFNALFAKAQNQSIQGMDGAK